MLGLGQIDVDGRRRVFAAGEFSRRRQPSAANRCEQHGLHRDRLRKGRAARSHRRIFVRQFFQRRSRWPLLGNVGAGFVHEYLWYALSLPDAAVTDRALRRVRSGFLQARWIEVVSVASTMRDIVVVVADRKTGGSCPDRTVQKAIGFSNLFPKRGL